MYRCAACEGPVEIAGGTIRRPCGHDDAGVLAAIAAKVEGVGGADPLPPASEEPASEDDAT